MADLGVSDDKDGIDGFAIPHFISALRNGFSGLSEFGRAEEVLTLQLQLQYHTYQTHALGATIQVFIFALFFFEVLVF